MALGGARVAPLVRITLLLDDASNGATLVALRLVFCAAIATCNQLQRSSEIDCYRRPHVSQTSESVLAAFAQAVAARSHRSFAQQTSCSNVCRHRCTLSALNSIFRLKWLAAAILFVKVRAAIEIRSFELSTRIYALISDNRK